MIEFEMTSSMDRDLRADDHAALYHALRQCRQVHCVFVFDREIPPELYKVIAEVMAYVYRIDKKHGKNKNKQK